MFQDKSWFTWFRVKLTWVALESIEEPGKLEEILPDDVIGKIVTDLQSSLALDEVPYRTELLSFLKKEKDKTVLSLFQNHQESL